ncbi:MAG: TolC family protein [Deltaproteobacteria bacterium]|nr:TolC family protein [Deltaproteobacteria bacterium]
MILCSLVLLLALQPPAAAAKASKNRQQPATWTVQAAVRFALAHSPDIAVTRHRIAAARAAVKEAQSAFYPRIGVSTSYSRTNNPMYSFGNILNQGVFNNTINFNDPGWSDNLDMTAGVNYRFYNGGHDQAGVQAARAGEAASELELAVVHSRLEFAVVRSFLTIVQARETVQARQSAVKAIAASLQVARARYAAGTMLKADLLNLEVQQSKTHENLIQARHGLALAKRGFLNLLGLAKGTVNIDDGHYPEQPIPANTSFARRPELKRMDAAIRAARAQVRQAVSGYYPTADAFVNYRIDKGYELDGSGNSWMGGVRLNYNLFDGHRTSAAVTRARALLAAAREQKRKLSLAINFEVEQAQLALEQAGQQLQVTKKMVEQADESARLSRARFKEGVILSSDLIEVENRLTDALVRRTVARASRRIAIADLRWAIGLQQFQESGDMQQTGVNKPGMPGKK